MRWSERQAALLAEMGIRLWQAPAGGAPERQEARGVADAPVADPGGAVTVPVGRAAAAVTGVPAAAPGGDPAVEVAVGKAVQRDVEVAAPPAVGAGTAAHAGGGVGVAGLPGAPDAVDASTLDWPALRAAVAGCTACTLCRSRTQTVFGVGHPRAHWMIVGEAPGEQEDRQGEPFVGRSGQLLDGMLRAIGLSRGSAQAPAGWGAADPARHVYIANTLKCRPPGNRNPAPDELARCEGYLIRQIELVQPKMILAMGRFAVQSLLRSSEPIGRLRGRVHRYRGVPLVVTYHPAYLLRNLPEKARAWDDLCLALDAVPGAPPLPAPGGIRAGA